MSKTIDFKALCSETKIKESFFSFFDLKQKCVCCGINQWWRTYLKNPSFWTDVDFSVCAAHMLSDETLIPFCKLHPQIQTLDIKFCIKLTNRALEETAKNLKDLKRLDLEGCGRKITDNGIIHLRGNKSLTYLNLNGCTQVTPKGLEMLIKEIKEIKDLRIGGLPTIEDKTIGPLVKAATNLRCLHLNSCSKLTDAGICQVAQIGATNLLELQLSYCGISDQSVATIAASCPNLTSLGLYGCFKVSDVALEALGKNCNKLEYLDLSLCQLCTDLGIQHLLDGKKNCSGTLLWLNLYDCIKLSNLSVILISKKCQQLKFFGIIRSGWIRTKWYSIFI